MRPYDSPINIVMKNLSRKILPALVVVLLYLTLQGYIESCAGAALPQLPPCSADSMTDGTANQSRTKYGVATGIIAVDGQQRSYSLFRPRALVSTCDSAPDEKHHTRLYPLVLVFHGSYANGRKIMSYTGMNDLADEENFLVAYPDMQYAHNWNLAKDFHNPDIDFVSALIRHLRQTEPVDPSRIYVTGYSTGADFVQLLACNPVLSSEIAAFAPVCSNLDRSWANQCQTSHPISMLLINGTADKLNSWQGDGKRWMSVPETFAFWARHNGSQVPDDFASKDCEPWGEQSTHAALVTATGGTSDCEVLLLKICGGGHTWPGSRPQNWFMTRFLGATHQSETANAVIWEFFERNPLRS